MILKWRVDILLLYWFHFDFFYWNYVMQINRWIRQTVYARLQIRCFEVKIISFSNTVTVAFDSELMPICLLIFW